MYLFQGYGVISPFPLSINYLPIESRNSKEREKTEMKKKQAKAVIVGGSIAGVSCAHALISAGWEVVVLEKSNAPPSGSPTGAGLGLDPLAQRIMGLWLGEKSDLLQKFTVPLTIDQV